MMAFTLNVGTYLAPFRLLEEPGPGSGRLGQTSMEAVRQRPAPMAKVRETLIGVFESRFGLSVENLFTWHPTIDRKAPSHAVFASTRT